MTPFGTTSAGKAVHRLDLSDGPLTASLLTWGSNLHDVRLAGIPHSLTLGSPDFAPYEGPLASAGGLIAPVVNRISGASAPLDGRTVELEERQGTGLTLHSGSAGTHRKLWRVEDRGPAHALLAIDLPHGEAGFPGRRRVAAHWLAEGASLTLTVEVTTDAPTWINVANHGYWNLDGSETIAGHVLDCPAAHYLPADEDGLVTGEVAPVGGTALDFRGGRTLAPGDTPNIDHNLILADARRDLARAATLTGMSGLSMTMESTEPGVQVYDGWKLADVGAPDHQGRAVAPHRGLALEAQGWPDAPNHAHFPSIRLDPGRTYRQVTRWSFEGP
jgi:aldose 1-epimerase